MKKEDSETEKGVLLIFPEISSYLLNKFERDEVITKWNAVLMRLNSSTIYDLHSIFRCQLQSEFVRGRIQEVRSQANSYVGISSIYPA